MYTVLLSIVGNSRIGKRELLANAGSGFHARTRVLQQYRQIVELWLLGARIGAFFVVSATTKD